MKVIRALCHIFVWLCMLCTAAMMLLMVSEVLSRWIFNKAILGSTEWAQVLLCCTMSSFGAAILCNRMTKVDILTSHLKPKTQVILDIIVLFLAAVAIGVLSWLPKWIFVAVFSLSYGVAALTTLCVWIRKIHSAIKGDWEKEAKLGDTDWEFAFGKHGVSSWSPEEKPGEDSKKEGGDA